MTVYIQVITTTSTEEEAREWICLAKAKSEDYQRIESLIREDHPYSVPEILAIPVSAGNKDYLAWLSEVTSH